MNPSEKMITGIFFDRASATRAFNWLQSRGYRAEDINILMTDRTRTLFKAPLHDGPIKPGTKATEGVAAGGVIGTAVGASLATVAALGTNFILPGVGLIVAGPLVASLAGSGIGAVTGGVIGGLVGLGITESSAHAYEEALRRGGVVFGVVPRTSEEARVIQRYFEEQKADNVTSI